MNDLPTNHDRIGDLRWNDCVRNLPESVKTRALFGEEGNADVGQFARNASRYLPALGTCYAMNGD